MLFFATHTNFGGYECGYKIFVDIRTPLHVSACTYVCIYIYMFLWLCVYLRVFFCVFLCRHTRRPTDTIAPQQYAYAVNTYLIRICGQHMCVVNRSEVEACHTYHVSACIYAWVCIYICSCECICGQHMCVIHRSEKKACHTHHVSACVYVCVCIYICSCECICGQHMRVIHRNTAQNI